MPRTGNSHLTMSTLPVKHTLSMKHLVPHDALTCSITIALKAATFPLPPVTHQTEPLPATTESAAALHLATHRPSHSNGNVPPPQPLLLLTAVCVDDGSERIASSPRNARAALICPPTHRPSSVAATSFTAMSTVSLTTSRCALLVPLLLPLSDDSVDDDDDLVMPVDCLWFEIQAMQDGASALAAMAMIP
ncbi:hypothetical protein Pelo_18717 [Pelomyxa schiedti]|nr:hypothetical protein Pelo_18717 [Pelomyxa schiedti]